MVDKMVSLDFEGERYRILIVVDVEGRPSAQLLMQAHSNRELAAG